MQFDLPSLVNLVLSSLIGVATSWWISHLYFKKNSPTQRILDELQKELPNYLLPVIRPQFFTSNSLKTLPEPGAPTDKDFPHVEYAKFEHRSYSLDQQIQALLKVTDLGYDLENPTGISILDHRQRPLPLQRTGFGFLEIQFISSALSRGEKYFLTISLRDLGGRTYTQRIDINVLE